MGSLIAFARSTGLRNYIESGTQISADVERDLLTSIFFPNSPLHDGAVIVQGQKITDEVMGAIQEMSRDRMGSLIAFARSTGLRNYIESGTQISAEVERDLLTSIFFPNSPLHDGAVIVQGQKVEAARCILPVSDARGLDPHLGLRHRAAVGLTERTDAFVIVTSEETGKISVAENGRLDVGLSLDEVEARLLDAFSPDRGSAPGGAAEPPPSPPADALST